MKKRIGSALPSLVDDSGERGTRAKWHSTGKAGGRIDHRRRLDDGAHFSQFVEQIKILAGLAIGEAAHLGIVLGMKGKGTAEAVVSIGRTRKLQTLPIVAQIKFIIVHR